MRNFDQYVYESLQNSYDEFLSSDDPDEWQE